MTTQKYDFHGQEAYVDGLEEGAKKEREQCCKDICWKCERGEPALQTLTSKTFYHLSIQNEPGSTMTVCKADHIRQRAVSYPITKKGDSL